ncbi:MAG TPA: hypothetical protein VFS34_07145 [Thermoanaerobaculia bacterium]|nr:hypothetical protein [Thermoanaerobaculia bacterium]
MSPCRRVSAALRAGVPLAPDAEQHLFGCDRCRRVARTERIQREIEMFARPPAIEAPVPPDFVARVMRGLPRPRAFPPIAGVWKWAAALAMFSAAAGYGYAVWAETISAGQQVASTSSAPVEEAAVLNF